LSPDFLPLIGPNDFEDGRILPPLIAIEIGLRAPDRQGHLTRDRDKMIHNHIRHPYLVDFARVGRYRSDVESTIDAIGAPFRVAYAHYRDGWGRRIKHIGTSACGPA
jgi:hypothetical protein